MKPERGPARTFIKIRPDKALGPASAPLLQERVLPDPNEEVPLAKRIRLRAGVIVSFVAAAAVGAGLVVAVAEGIVPGVRVVYAPTSSKAAS